MDLYTEGGPVPDASPKRSKTEKRTPDGRLQAYWREIQRYDKATSDWREAGDNIVKLYLDEDGMRRQTRRFALLWSNVETLKPAIYAKCPIIQCGRKHKDRDKVARTGAEILERAVNTQLELYNADETFRMVRDDRLLPGRGQAWVRYEAQFQKDGEDDDADETLAHECVKVDYVHWTDFGHNVARTWNDVWMVWRWVYKSYDEVAERFGEQTAKGMTYDAKPSDEKDELTSGKARIAEVWDKRKRKVIWISRGLPRIMEESDPPVSFGRFFPCPEPCYATKTSKSLIPTPDYQYYRDQAREINDLTDKISAMTEWLVVKGFVPAGSSSEGIDAIEQALRAKNNSLLVPVESWASWSEKGGAKGLVEWMPIQDIINTLKAAIETRAQIIQDVYQETGISDVLRGQTDPNETLGAQQLKAQTGSRRLQNTKDELARFCKDVGLLVAEVIAEVFSPQTLQDISGFKYQPPMPPGMQAQQMPQQVEPGQSPIAPEANQVFDDAVIQLLRDDRMRGFRIDIETDSTVQLDQEMEKQSRMEFLTAIGGFMTPAVEALERMPALAPAFGEILMFAVRGFRAGRNLEESIEKGMGQLSQMAQQPKPPGPEEIKAQMEAERMKGELADKAAQREHDQGMFQLEAQEKQAEFGRKEKEHQFKMAELGRKTAADIQAQQLEGQRREVEHGRKIEELDRQSDQKRQDGEMMQSIANIKLDREKSITERDEAKQGMEAAAGDYQGASQGIAAIAEAIQIMAQQQAEAQTATQQAMQALMQGLSEHMSEQTKTTRESAAQQLKIAAAPRRLKRNQDGSKETELVL